MSKVSAINERYGFILLLISLVALLTVPAYWQLQYKGVITSGLITAVMLSFLVLVAQKKIELLVGIVLASPVVIYNWTNVGTTGSVPHMSLIFLNILFYGFIAAELLRHILTAKKADFNIIAAAICMYFIAGILWATIYFSIEVRNPGSILVGVTDLDELFNQLLYFSFVTMTTLGFGDITPQSMIAQRWAVLQAIFGQFYLAIIIARLVALYKVE